MMLKQLATATAVAVLVGACAGGAAVTPSPSTVPSSSPSTAPSTPSATPRPTTSPSPLPTLTPTPSATPSGQAVPLPAEGPNLFAGTYSTNFDPPLTLTIGHEVDLDCVPGYRCRGDINVNQPDWLDFEFGNVHGSELMIFGFDKFTDPDDPNRSIDTPADFAAWIAAHDAVSIVAPAHAVLVGGVAGVQLDIQNGDQDVPFGPSTAKVRLTALQIDGRQVVIQGTLGPENTVGDFNAAVDGLQKVIDSITWGGR